MDAWVSRRRLVGSGLSESGDQRHMPLYWVIDSRERMMTAVAEGVVTVEEANNFLDVMDSSGALSYRRLFDARTAEAPMSGDDIMGLAVRMRSMQQNGRPGPLAMVVPRDKHEQFARVLGVLAVPDRPIRFFNDLEKARAWLDDPAVRDWAGPEVL
jgi:hypothetical protein